MTSTDKTIVLLTGANTGVGYETVKCLLKSSLTYEIIMGGRSQDKLDAAIKRLHEQVPETKSSLATVLVDVEDDETIAKAAAFVEQKYGRVDILVNNAGAEFDIQYPQLGWTKRDMFQHSFNVNVTGTHLLTEAIAPLLLKSSHPRLIFLTSGTASLSLMEDDTFILNKVPEPGWPKKTFRELPAYKASKLALNMIMRDWERLLRGDGVWVACVDPGFFVTGLGGDPELTRAIGAGDVSKAGPWLVSVIEGKRDHQRGKILQEPKDAVLAW